MKKTTGILVLTIVLANMPILIIGESSGVEEIIYIKPDGLVDPPTTPIQRDGNTYIFTANISKQIVVQRNNILVNGNAYTLQGNGSGKGFDISGRSNVTIKNVYISKFDYGIYLSESHNNTIENNIITNCVYGILPARSPNTIIRNNIIAHNRWDGIFLTASDHSRISNNSVISHGKWGIYLGYSSKVTLRDNRMTGNTWNFGVSVNFLHDIDDSNTVDGKPIYYWVEQHDTQVPTDAGYVAIINSTNISVRNANLTKNGQGIVLVNSKKCLIEGTSITRMGYYGIQLVDSDDNIISTNNISDNIDGYFDVGIALQSDSTGNTIINNLIENNGKGLLFYNSSGNLIYHNNFVNNIVQVSSEGSINTWDNGYPSGGNYWSDYSGEDKRRGLYQNEPNSDGIGDTLYIIDEANRDRYPYMNRFQGQINVGSADVNWIYVVTGVVVLTVTVAGVIYIAIREKTRGAKKTGKQEGDGHLQDA